MDDDRTYRLNRQRNSKTRVNLRDVVVTRDERRTERDLPAVEPLQVSDPALLPPLAQALPPLAQALPPLAQALPPLAQALPAPAKVTRRTAPMPPVAPIQREPPSQPVPEWPDRRAFDRRAALDARASSPNPSLPPMTSPRRAPQGTINPIERRTFGGVELVIEHRADGVTLSVPGAAPLIGTRSEVIDLIAGLLGRS